MKAPLLLALYTTKRTVCEGLFCHTIVGHIDRKLVREAAQDSDTLNRLAPRPQADFFQAVARQICTIDPNRMLDKPDRQRPPSRQDGR